MIAGIDVNFEHREARPVDSHNEQERKPRVGDAKLESEGKADKIEGQVQNAVGGFKDTLKGK